MKRKMSAVLLVVAGLAVGLMFNGVWTTPAPVPVSAQEQVAESPQDVEDLMEFAGKLEKLFHYAANRVNGAVVAIQTTQVVRERVPGFPFDEFFGPGFPDLEEYFGLGDREVERQRQSLGSGVIIDDEGHILTNNHVIAGADQLSVKLADGRVMEGEIVGTDPKTDLAVIRIKGDVKDLPVAELGDSTQLQVGDWVLAVGSPFGLTQTVSAGIVSATGRTGIGTADYESMIQTDAAINPGNSGGPLINLRGQVIGINAAIVSRSGGNLGIGFAIPIDMAKEVLPDLVAGRQVLTPEMAEGFGFEGTDGVMIDEVIPGGPADDAGLKAGDIVIEYDGHKTKTMNDLRRAVAMTKPNSRVRVTVWREGKERTFSVTIGNQERAVAASDWLGVTARELTAEAAAQMGWPELKGVVITAVEAGSPAASILRPGYVIVSVNRVKVDSVEEFRRLANRVRPGGVLLLRVVNPNNRRSTFLSIRRPMD